MIAENLFMYISSVCLLIAIMFLYGRSKKKGLINAIVFIFYTSIFYYLFFFDTGKGTSLVWLVYSLFCTWVQLFVVAFLIIKKVKDETPKV
jgi:uncharacterized MAPEG superfamily protein